MTEREIITLIENNRHDIHAGKAFAESGFQSLEEKYASHVSAEVRLSLAINKALLLACIRTDNNAAIAYAQETLRQYEAQGAAAKISRLMWIIGHCCILTGAYPEAHQWLSKSIDVAYKDDKDLRTSKQVHADALHDLAMLTYLTGGNNAKVRDLLRQAIDLFQEISMPEGVGICVMGLGNVSYSEEKWEEALTAYHAAAKIFEQHDVQSNLAAAYSNIGMCSLAINDLATAKDFLDKSLELREQMNNKPDIAISCFNLSNYYRAIGNSERAIGWLERCVSIYEEVDNQIHLPSALQNLALLYEENGNYEKACATLKKLLQLINSTHTREKDEAIAQAQARFEVVQKEKESALLREKNKQIEQYAHLLEISNNELRQFAHVASHDLKEPLRMVSSFMGLLEKKAASKLTEEELQFLHFALEGAHRMENLINDLLALSKVNAVSHKERLNLEKVIQEVQLNLQDYIRERRAVITVGNLPDIIADRAHIVQLFQNLISNAIKYNQSEIPSVEIEASRNGASFTISVADNGIGIPEKFRQQVFELFKRLHSRSEYPGTGIGLTICKKIVEQLNGRINVESEEGKGSRFVIELPVELLAE
ncbi:MAG: ATP-binding protein [Chitinophagales bacterium]|nr:ATP-binding protein [Chitinophagales bacterium]MDW8418816.1 ATP-binding protein [Chitinophagales bacterium]